MIYRPIARPVLFLAAALAGCGGGGSDESPLPPATVADAAPLSPAKFAVTAVGAAQGGAIQKMVPTAGDTLISADGRLTIEIPPGALAAPTMISIQPLSNQAPGGLGTAYRLGPDGTTFTSPVKLTFTPASGDLRGTELLALKVAWQSADGNWNSIKAVKRDDTAKTVSVETSHFTDWSLVAGYQLRPPSGLLKPTESIQLVVSACSEEDTDSELSQLTNRLFECRPESGLIAVDAWSVNAVPNGNASVGTITNSDDTGALYTAPASAPKTGNPVAITAAVVDKASGRKTLLNASMAIDIHPVLKGTITSSQVDQTQLVTVTTSAEVSFAYDEAAQAYLIIPPSSLQANLDATDGDCVTHAVFKGPIAPLEGRIILTEVAYFASGATTGTFVGTKTCSVAHTTEPLSIERATIWWPALFNFPPAVKPDGSIEDSVTNHVNPATGEITNAAWSLIPQTP